MKRGVAVGEPEAIEVAAAAEAARGRRREVALDVVHGVARVRVLGVAPRQEHRRAEVDGLAPPLREDVALDAEPLHVLRVGRHVGRRDDLIADEPDGLLLLRVEMHFHRRRVQVPRRAPPVLPLPLVHVQPDGVAVGAGELRVDVHERLHPVVAGRQIPQALDGMAEGGRVDDGRPAGHEAVDLRAEERHAGRPRLLDGRPPVVAADRHVDAAGHRLGPRAGRKRNLEAQPAGVAGAGARRGRCGSHQGERHRQRADRGARAAPGREHTTEPGRETQAAAPFDRGPAGGPEKATRG